MTRETLNVPSSLAHRYQDLHDALYAFTTEAAQIHQSMAVKDDASRALHTALSRITAYSDQLQMVLSLIGEDVDVTEEIGAEPGPEFDSPELEDCFYEWLRAARTGAQMVN